MRYRRTQLGGDVVTAERRYRHSREGAGHHCHEDGTAPGRSQRCAENDDREHGAKAELQSDRLMDQRQSRDDDPIGRAARQGDGTGSRERQRDREHRQRRRTEQIRPGRVRGEGNTERQQRNQHRDHQPALRPAATEQHDSHDQRQCTQVDRRRQPAQSERDPEVVTGDQPHQLTGEPAAHEAERVVDGVVRHPVHVERNDIDREAQYRRRPDRDCDRDADVQQRAGPRSCGKAQVHHQMRPNEQWKRTNSDRRGHRVRVPASMRRCSRRRFGRRRR